MNKILNKNVDLFNSEYDSILDSIENSKMGKEKVVNSLKTIRNLFNSELNQNQNKSKNKYH